jgi:hypothetical protein
VALAEFGGLTEPNASGSTPLENNDPARPIEAYFRHVDWVVHQANRRGMYIGFLPTWGDKVNKKWGEGPEIFTPQNARIYGRWLGRRYARAGLVWILGGDRPIETPSHLGVWREMAAGIREGDAGAHLMTFHPTGGQNSADRLHSEPWLDINMVQSGHHARDIPNWQPQIRNRTLLPSKPTLDAEPRYEDHPVNWKRENGWFDAFDVRQAAYWSMLSGACGHTYGDHNIWQFYSSRRPAVSAARTPWQQALLHPGAVQMGHMRRLFERMRWQKLNPAQQLLADERTGAEMIRAAASEDGTRLVVYTPYGYPIRLKPGAWRTEPLGAEWFDPRTARRTPAHISENGGCTPPGSPARGSDWVLTLAPKG